MSPRTAATKDTAPVMYHRMTRFVPPPAATKVPSFVVFAYIWSWAWTSCDHVFGFLFVDAKSGGGDTHWYGWGGARPSNTGRTGTRVNATATKYVAITSPPIAARFTIRRTRASTSRTTAARPPDADR